MLTTTASTTVRKFISFQNNYRESRLIFISFLAREIMLTAGQQELSLILMNMILTAVCRQGLKYISHYCIYF